MDHGTQHMNDLINKIIRGSGDRPTRFHDERGNLVSPGGYIFLFPSFTSTFLNHFFGYLPQTPWLSYRARKTIAGLLLPDWTVLELGSGTSTAWFAQRCRELFSIEHNPVWYATVKKRLSGKNISNVRYFLKNEENYADFSGFPDSFFDFVLIDGIRRADCVRCVMTKVKPGGWIYLDNTDMSARSKPGNDYQRAEQLLLTFVQSKSGFVKYFTDFVPTNFIVKQGMLVQVGKAQRENQVIE